MPILAPCRASVEQPRAIQRHAAFTLIELLVVVGVIVLMMTLAVPAFNAIRGGSDFTSELYDISGTLDQARAYAMSNNTFVLVGIMEVSAGQGSSANPQVSGTGTVAIGIIASKDGTRPYQNLIDNTRNNSSPPLTSWPTQSGTGAAFEPVTKLASFPNLHIVDLQGGNMTVPTTGGMMRPTVLNYYDVGNTANCTSAISFGWPIGTALSGGATPQYSFGYQTGNGVVIEFDPQGSARIITNSGPNGPLLDAIPQNIEIGLEPARGSVAATISTEENGQMAAIQIDGMSGAVQIYRP
jgi:Tfp pilus assembly protein FimT